MGIYQLVRQVPAQRSLYFSEETQASLGWEPDIFIWADRDLIHKVTREK